MSKKKKGIFYLCCLVLLAIVSRRINNPQQEQIDTEEQKLIKKIEQQFKSKMKISSYDYDEGKNTLHIFINLKSSKDNKRKLEQEDLKNAFDILAFIEEYCNQQPNSKLSNAQKNVRFMGRYSAANFGVYFCSNSNEFYFTEIHSNYICSLSDLSIFTNIKKIYFNGLISVEDIEPIRGMKNLVYLCLSWVEDKKDEEIISKELKETLPDCEVVWSNW